MIRSLTILELMLLEYSSFYQDLAETLFATLRTHFGNMPLEI